MTSRLIYTYPNPPSITTLVVASCLPLIYSKISLGMFMVDLELRNDRDNITVARSSRPVRIFSLFTCDLVLRLRKSVLVYKSSLLRWLWTLVYSFLLLLGFSTESQSLSIPLLEGFVEQSVRLFFSVHPTDL